MHKNNEIPKIYIAINGFGRIGKAITRLALKNPNIELVAINDRSKSPEYIAYLLEYDSSHGHWEQEKPTYDAHYIIIGTHKIQITNYSDPNDIRWDIYSKNITVIDCTGQNTTLEKAQVHVKNGATNVIVTSPSNDIPMIVFGCNEHIYIDQQIISCASCTTNASGPILALLDKQFGITNATITTIHSLTGSQNIVDGTSTKNPRLGRCGINNIIPTTTGAAKSIEKVYEPLIGKCNGISFRVPTTNASVVDMTVSTDNADQIDIFLNCLESNSIIDITREQLVSSDFTDNTHSSVIDLLMSGQVGTNLYKIVAWYDNEWGYSSRIIDLIMLMNI